MYTLKYQEFSEALYQALQPDPFYIRLLQSIPGDNEKREALISYLDYSMYEAEKYGLLFIPGQHRYGASVWSKPLGVQAESEKGHEKKTFLKSNLGDGVLDAYVQMVDFMSAKLEGLIAPESWYLSIVGIKPEFQGKGLGAGLVKEALQQTDKLSLSTYLETFTPKNIPFYNRLGYETVASFLEPLTNAIYWVLVRKPRL